MRWLAMTAALLLTATAAEAAELKAMVSKVDKTGIKDVIGSVIFADGTGGAEITTDLRNLPPGPHGFHIHSVGDCSPAPGDDGAMAAGAAAKGHWDPDRAGGHLGPQGEGHRGDLPVLTVGEDGTATETVTAPRISDVSELDGKAVMIHAGGDNYADAPAQLGGGGARIACGIIQAP